jgi:hypothetical protein
MMLDAGARSLGAPRGNGRRDNLDVQGLPRGNALHPLHLSERYAFKPAAYGAGFGNITQLGDDLVEVGLPGGLKP